MGGPDDHPRRDRLGAAGRHPRAARPVRGAPAGVPRVPGAGGGDRPRVRGHRRRGPRGGGPPHRGAARAAPRDRPGRVPRAACRSTTTRTRRPGSTPPCARTSTRRTNASWRSCATSCCRSRRPRSGSPTSRTATASTAPRSSAGRPLALEPEEVHRLGIERFDAIDGGAPGGGRGARVRERRRGDRRAHRERREHAGEPRGPPGDGGAAGRAVLGHRAGVVRDARRARTAPSAWSSRSARPTSRSPSTTRRPKTARDPGVYYVNAYDLEDRALHHVASVTYHEANPGHHFQIALEQEMTDRPLLRRFGAGIAARRVRRGVGPVRRAARRRDGPVPRRVGAHRDAR